MAQKILIVLTALAALVLNIAQANSAQLSTNPWLEANDDEAVAAFDTLSRMEGIIPALESSHALAQALKTAKTYSPEESIIVCLSGRGDKDMDNIAKYKANLEK